MSNSVRPQRRQPTRLPHPWDSPGKNTGVGCHFLLQCMKVKSESEVAQSCLTPSDPWTAAYQTPLSMGFSRQEYWSGVPLPSPIYTTMGKIDSNGNLLHSSGSSALWWPRRMGWGVWWKGGPRGRGNVYTSDSPCFVQQKLTQHYKVIILQLKRGNIQHFH